MYESWVADAACGRRPDLMTGPFDEAGDPAVRSRLEWAAKAVCRACPVLIDCRCWALRHEVAGVCGGFTEAERERWRRDVGVEVEPTTTLPFLPIDIACRDLLDAGLDDGEVVLLVVGRGYSRPAAEAHVRSARRSWAYTPAPEPPAETEAERHVRELVEAVTAPTGTLDDALR